MHIFYDFAINNDNVIIDFKCISNNLEKNLFNLPHSYGSANNLFNDIVVLNSNVIIHYNYLIHTTKKNITVQYTFRNINIFQQHHAFSNKNFIVFNSLNGLILPKYNTNKKFNITFSTNKIIFISGVGKINKNHTMLCSCDKLYNLMFVYSTKWVDVSNTVVCYDPNGYLFIEPNYMIRKINKFIKLCNKLFGKDATFLISYTDQKVSTNGISTFGSGHYMGVNFSVMSNKKSNLLNSEIFIYLCHELFHFYNVKKSSVNQKWLTEGFTEFFCRFFSLNTDDFENEITKLSNNYYNNKYKNVKNSYITENKYWNNHELRQLCYTKGFTYALYLYKTQKDTFIKNFIKMCKYYKKSNNELDNKIIKKFFNDPNFENYIIDGKTIVS